MAFVGLEIALRNGGKILAKVSPDFAALLEKKLSQSTALNDKQEMGESNIAVLRNKQNGNTQVIESERQ